MLEIVPLAQRSDNKFNRQIGVDYRYKRGRNSNLVLRKKGYQ